MGCRLESLPLSQPLEGGVISPPFWGVALLVAIAAGVCHVVQRHHHLVWVRVFVQFHHARHHRGPAICSEHGGREGRWDARMRGMSALCAPGTPRWSPGRGRGASIPNYRGGSWGSERSRCLPRSTQEDMGGPEFTPGQTPERPCPRHPVPCA